MLERFGAGGIVLSGPTFDSGSDLASTAAVLVLLLRLLIPRSSTTAKSGLRNPTHGNLKIFIRNESILFAYTFFKDKTS